MASIGNDKQRGLRYAVLFVLSLCLLATNAQVTRRQLLRSFHKAATYYNAGNVDKAIETYREIAELVPQYPDTYLRMAEIYDKADNTESAIVMYRKYINLEMDDAKIKEPSARLRTLESQLGMEHYEEAEEKQALELFAKYNVIQQPARTEVSVDENSAASGEGLQLFAGDTPKLHTERDVQEDKPSGKVAVDAGTGIQPAVDEQNGISAGGSLALFSLSALVETRNESLNVFEESSDVSDSIADKGIEESKSLKAPPIPIDDNLAPIETEVTQSENLVIEEELVLDESFLSKAYLAPVENAVDSTIRNGQGCEYPLLFYGRKARLEEYRVNRSNSVGVAPQTVAPDILPTILSGRWVSSECKGNGHETWIFNISQAGNIWYVALDDESGIYFNDEADFVDVSWSVIKSFWSYDHAMSNQLKDLRAKTVNAEIKNDILSYTFVTEHQQKPHKAVYTWGRNILEGVAEFIPFGGVVSQVGNSLINYVSEKDQQKTYTTTLRFFVKAVTADVLRCEYVLSERERSSAGDKEITDRKACYLYKVDEAYRGFDFVSDNEHNVVNKKLYTLLKKEAETDPSRLYPLAYMYYYGAGTNKSIAKAVHQMQMLAEKEDCDRAKAWLVPVCYNLSMDEKAYPYRVVRKYFRNYANEMLGDLLLKNYPYAYSLQADVFVSDQTNTDKIVPLYQKAVALGDVYALYKLGMVYIEGVLEEQDVQKAIQYLTMAAEKGYADAYHELALLYKRGRLVEKDYAKYIDYLYNAIDCGSVKALKELSEAYCLGLGVKSDFNVANRIKEKYMQASCEEWKEVLNIYGYNTIL